MSESVTGGGVVINRPVAKIDLRLPVGNCQSRDVLHRVTTTNPWQKLSETHRLFTQREGHTMSQFEKSDFSKYILDIVFSLEAYQIAARQSAQNGEAIIGKT